MKGRPLFLRERPASSACEYLPPRLCVGGAGVVGVLSQREAYVTLSFSLSIWFMDLKTQRAVRVSQGQCRDREGTQRGYLGARRVPPPTAGCPPASPASGSPLGWGCGTMGRAPRWRTQPLPLEARENALWNWGTGNWGYWGCRGAWALST